MLSNEQISEAEAVMIVLVLFSCPVEVYSHFFSLDLVRFFYRFAFELDVCQSCELSLT